MKMDFNSLNQGDAKRQDSKQNDASNQVTVFKFEDMPSASLKEMTSEQIFDKLINSGSQWASILKEKVYAEKAPQMANVKNDLPEGNNSMTQENMQFADLHAKLDTLIVLLTPKAQAPATTPKAETPAPATPVEPPKIEPPKAETPAPATPVEPPKIEPPTADVLNQIMARFEKIEAAFDKFTAAPAPSAVHTGSQSSASTSNSTTSDHSATAKEIEKLKAEIAQMPDGKEKVEKSKQMSRLQMSLPE